MTGHVITAPAPTPAAPAPATPGTGTASAPAAAGAGAAPAPPATAPASVPVTGGWATLSAAMTAEVPPIADRDDLTVSIAPGAAFGHPAAFVPSLRAIELDGAHLKIAPADANPASNSDRNQYPAVWGALVHECAHAKHSVWQPPLLAHPEVVTAAKLLEESRIEAAQIRRRPDDRHWLRASATEIVIGDNGGATAAAHLPRTTYAAAHNAALVLGRIDAGVLDESECAPLVREIESILGTDTLAKLRAIWREAHTVADADTAAMLELGRQWFDIVGPEPHATPIPASSLGAAIEATAASIAAEVAANPVPADPAETAAAARRSAAARDEQAQQTAEKVFGKGTGDGGTSPIIHRTRTPRPKEQTAARVLARALDTAAARERTTVKTTSVVPPGRVRMRGVLARQAQLAAGAIPTAEPFTRTTRKRSPYPPLQVGIACDVSSSMGKFAAPVSSAAWIIARAAELVAMPATTATVTFGATVTPITYPGTAPTRVTEFGCPDGDHAIDHAIVALEGALGLARPGTTRLLVIISDGIYSGPHRDRAQKRLDMLRAAGCAALWLAPAHEFIDPLANSNPPSLTDPATTAAEIARAATAAVRAS
ncbi:VWA domain-containing protein [Nocardia asteroides]|uniref:VWA domain-containing protein n=1 Tax=Nocardia asteroides TaxID=1824 RepID=UPI001E577B44|nr:VWA domain-containing protein [Nocardia asteroides]UGT53983.1 VWA domain-containing protein [Nocardia asteroides]